MSPNEMPSVARAGATTPGLELDDEPVGLLVVDDEVPILSAIRRTLRNEPYVVHTVESGRAALELLARERIGVVISDHRMDGMDGIELLGQVKHLYPEVQRVMMTAFFDFPALQASVNQSEIFRFIQKPWDSQVLIRTISGAFDQYRILRDNDRLWTLTERKNEQLKALNHDLEARIARRTRQLARAKVEWESTFDAIVDPVAIIDDAYGVVRANLAYARSSQVDVRDVPGKRCYAVLAGRDAPCADCPLTQALAGATTRAVDIATRDGRTLEVVAYPLPVERSRSEERPLAELESGDVSLRAVCCYRDVTEARALRNELERTRRLASLGLFVGGVAHEINNPLGSILAFTQILLGTPISQDPDVGETLREIEASAIRTKRIIESLVSFAHGSSARHTELELSALVSDVVQAFTRDYGGAVRLESFLEPELPKVRGDAPLLNQLVRNLLQNAQHSMHDRPGGRVVVRVERGAGEDVVLEVSDEGSGIPENLLGRIYDPFFTTKQDRGGTGLGLSICHRIVEQHGGVIEVRSRVGEGTTFRVTFRGVAEEAV